MFKYSVVLPCYNEVSNIGKLINQIRNSGLPKELCEITVVDDCSTDGTTELVSWLSAIDSGITHIVTEERKGLAESILIGLKESNADFVAVMDSDGMHDPAYLPRMFELALKENSLIIGSRFVSGGSSHGNVYPHLSRFVNLLVQRILKSKVNDQLCGFFVCNRRRLLDMNTNLFVGFGEYFISVVNFFEKSDGMVVELGTIHKVRDGGLRKSRRIRMFFSYISYALWVRR